MQVSEFIKHNRKEIDRIIMEYYHVQITSDAERRQWILNDEGLYRWAHQEGVNI